jgi:lysozyme family protein
VSIDTILNEIIRREGGFVNHPHDRGGATKYGITHTTLADHRRQSVTTTDVMNLTEDEAREIYRKQYVVAPRFNQIFDLRLQEAVVDGGVHSGTRQAALWLQRAAGVKDDGIVGVITLGAVNNGNPDTLYYNFLAQRANFLLRLIGNDHRQASFARGWANRINEFLTKG